MASSVDLSVVIACYNEANILSHSLEELIAVLDATQLSWELVFVDDRSIDRTLAIIHEWRQQHPTVAASVIAHATNSGRGKTVTDGFLVARGRIVGYLDIDMEVHARYIPSMVDAIDRLGYDVATAWRIYQATRSGLVRALSSKIYHWLVFWALGLPYRDTETGFKFFRREAITDVLKRVRHSGWFWDTEIMAYAFRAGLRVIELPCVFMRREDKVSSVRLVHDSIAYVRDLNQFRREFRSFERPVGPEALSNIAPISRRDTNRDVTRG